LADVLGRSRLRILLELADVAESGLSTGDLARRLELSAATVSVHTAALRAAGLIASTRDGKSVLHRRAALADLLLGPADRGDGADRRIR
jgi:DNA-binding transcriptional ArsR family regulator